MADRTCRIGLHGRNDEFFEEADYQVIREAHIETLKMMSLTHPAVFKRIRNEHPNLEFIVRLHDDRMGRGHHPTAQQFAERMAPLIKSLQPYASKFEIHNEPNHQDRIEGWGDTDDHARDFDQWYQRVFTLLKRECPWALLGFPGLAIPHRDREWLEICRTSVEMSDFLGVHAYWQTTTQEPDNHLARFWGLRFKSYHASFPNKIIDILEAGNSNARNGLPITDQEIAEQFVEFFQELFKYPYINSASPFILSSPDSSWESFAWRKRSGQVMPVVKAVGDMSRPPLRRATIEIGERQRYFEQTNQTVSGAFLDFFDKYGLDMCGYPITPVVKEDGLPVQYFQRIVLEEFKAGQIRPRLVGAQLIALRERVKVLEDQLRTGEGPDRASLIKPAITDISEQLARHASKRYASRDLAQIETIVIHHTALDASIGPERIARVLVEQRDMAGIPYHYFIAGDGTIFQTQDQSVLTSHADQFSKGSLGVAFAGDFTDAVPTAQQLEAGGKLCAYLMLAHSVKRENIKGRKELVPHASPGKQWLEGKRWKDELLVQVDRALAALPTAPGVGDDSLAALKSRIADLEKQLVAAQTRIADLERQLAETSPPRAVPQPSVKDVIDDLPKHPTKRYQTRQRSQIDNLLIHHSAGPPSVGAAPIARYHVDDKGWPGIGYHYFIYDDGRIEQTQPLEAIAYHAGEANRFSVGICLAGDFMDQPPPDAQLLGTGQLAAWLLSELDLPLEAIQPHKHFRATDCPGSQWDSGAKWGEKLLNQVKEALAGAGPVVSPPSRKPLGHYLLFWQTPDDWAKEDFFGAQNYIGRFRTTVGFSLDDAVQAQHVTIIGGTLGVSSEAEAALRAAGCKVERVAGENFAETKAMLDKMAKEGKRFLTF
jgi:N-acetyl-anhydromuramyl-L-alanine amidase AmpD